MSVTKLPVKQPSDPAPLRILSLDGGGVRGVMSTVMLKALEERLGEPLHRHFDLIAGTSVGAILAAAVAQGRTADEAQHVFESEIAATFEPKQGSLIHRVVRQVRGKPKYCELALTASLRRIFGASVLGDAAVPVVVVAYDIMRKSPVAFRSDNPKHKYLETWEVVKTSSAAPTIFEEHTIRYADNSPGYLVDGGLCANNPVLLALSEADADLHEIEVVSIGTGAVRNKKQQVRSVLDHSKVVAEAAFYGSSNTADRIAGRFLGSRYFRLQPPIHDGLAKLDGVENIPKLTDAALTYLRREGGEIIDRFCAPRGQGGGADTPLETNEHARPQQGAR
jgi:patatin-like phospholipase/acyl hydrolase